MDISSRPYADTDAAALAELFNTCDIAAGADATYTEAETRVFMNGLIRDHATDTRMLFAADGRLLANASVEAPADGSDHTRIFGAVHPDFRGNGLGRELFGWQLERITEMRRKQSPDGTWDVMSVCDTREIASIHLYIRYGLTPVRYFASMYVDLDPATIDRAATFPVAATLRTEAYRPELLTALHTAHMEVFADHWGFSYRDVDAWSVLSVESPEFRPDLSLIAFDGPDIAAYVLVYDMLGDSRIYVRSVGTRQPWRGRGLATSLLAQVLRNAAAQGAKSARLDVDAENPTGALGVYERLGFAAIRSEVAYSIPC